MPSSKGGDADFDWNKTSTNLQAALQNRGPLGLRSVGAAYKNFTGTELKLNGLKLRACVKQGLIGGIILNGGTIALDGKDSDSNMATGKCKPSSTPLQTRGTGRGLAQDTNKTRSLVSADAPVLHVVTDKASWLSTIRAVSTNANETTVLRGLSAGKPLVISVAGNGLGTEDGAISLIEVAAAVVGRNSNTLMILSFNVATLGRTETGRKILHDELCALLGDADIIKVVCDFADQAIALKRHFGKDLQLQSMFDAQIAYEALYSEIGGDIASISKAFVAKPSGLTVSSGGETVDDSNSWRLVSSKRSTILLWEAIEGMRKALVEENEWDNVIKASHLRITFAMEKMLPLTRRLTFRDKSKVIGGGTGRVLVSYELKKAREASDAAKADSGSTPLSSQDVVENSLTPGIIQRLKGIDANGSKPSQRNEEDPNSPKDLLELMPEEFFQEQLSNRHTASLEDLVEVVLDEGMRPYAQFRGHGRVPLMTDQSVVVTKNHIDKVVGSLERDGQFGKDNRAGFPGKLHRVSVMRDKVGSIYGVTLRVGRFFNGSAGMIDDLLFHVADSPESPERPASVLILGEAGSGKTTVIRDICRKISASETLVIVDTSNEIAGDGRLPHREAIGLSRRIMVADRSNQHRVMVEALQNHTPRTIVVDEISNNLEARACQDIKSRGVRLVASAHGDLESLMKNPCLNTLVGGTTSVTLGDAMAKHRGSKVITQRTAMPVFDTVIQLHPGDVNTWSVVRNVAPAVDGLLSGGTYDVEQRTRLVDDDHQQGLGSEDVIFLQQHRRHAKQHRRFY